MIVAVGFAAGIALEVHVGAPRAALLAAAALVLLGAAACAAWWERLKPAALPVVALLAAATGGLYCQFRSRPAVGISAADLVTDGPCLARVRGWVADTPFLRARQVPGWKKSRDFSQVSTRFDLRPRQVCLRGEWHAMGGRVRVSVAEAVPGLHYGDSITLTCWLRPRPEQANPGEFDYGRYLKRRGIDALAAAPSAGNLSRAGESAGNPGLRLLFGLKDRMGAFVDGNMDARAAAVVRCLLLGERRALPREDELAFRRTGTVHFLAVSGLHVALLAASVWWLLSLLGCRHRTTALVVLAFVCVYAILGGLRTPIMRASIMAGVFCFGFVLGRRPCALNSLAFAMLLVLLIQPMDLCSKGFQLSFVAVAGIIIFYSRVMRVLFRRRALLERLQEPAERSWAHWAWAWVLDTFCLSLVAWLVTTPLVAYHFLHITPYAALFSVALLPVVWLLLLCGFPVVMLGWLVGGFVQPFVILAELFAKALLLLAVQFDRVPGVELGVRPLPLWAVAGFYVLLLVAAGRRRLGLRLGQVAIIGLLVLNVGILAPLFSAPPRDVEISVIAVGSGSATLVRFPEGGVLVYDCGSASRPDIGARVAAPFLWHKGVRQIDCLIVSHGDMDHWSGVADLLEHFEVGVVFLPATYGRRGKGLELLDILREKKAQVVRVGAGDRISGPFGTDVEILHPCRNMQGWPMLTPNNASCVIRIRSGGASVLLTGDLEMAGVQMLLRENPGLRADVLVAPHHGMDPRATKALAERVKARLILVSSDRKAPGPGDSAAVYSTAECGAMEVMLRDGAAPELKTFLSVRSAATD